MVTSLPAPRAMPLPLHPCPKWHLPPKSTPEKIFTKTTSNHSTTQPTFTNNSIVFTGFFPLHLPEGREQFH